MWATYFLFFKVRAGMCLTHFLGNATWADRAIVFLPDVIRTVVSVVGGVRVNHNLSQGRFRGKQYK